MEKPRLIELSPASFFTHRRCPFRVGCGGGIFHLPTPRPSRLNSRRNEKRESSPQGTAFSFRLRGWDLKGPPGRMVVLCRNHRLLRGLLVSRTSIEKRTTPRSFSPSHPMSYQAAPPRDMVPGAGNEPVRSCSCGILNPGRLPIPPHPHI